MDQELNIEVVDSKVNKGIPEGLLHEPSKSPATLPVILPSNIVQIRAMMDDPDTELAEISRLIAVEMTDVISVMSGVGERQGRSDTALNNQVKALRELQRTLVEADNRSKKDVLNMDGPKFGYVFRELMKLFDQALVDGGVEPQAAKSVKLQFRDLVQKEDERIRRELSKIEVGK